MTSTKTQVMKTRKSTSNRAKILSWVRKNKTVAVMAIIAVICLSVGTVFGRFIQSPADIAAKAAPPRAGLITVPVENRIIEAQLVTRANVTFADAIDVTVNARATDAASVVTGFVPKVGEQLLAGKQALEISARPLIVMPGKLPAFRDIKIGTKGPDVVQLKEGLRNIGLDGGDPADNEYTQHTAEGVARLYERLGYPAPQLLGNEKGDDPVAAAQESVSAAQSAVTSAEKTLERAKKGAPETDRIQSENAVKQAQRELATLNEDPHSTATSVQAAQDVLRLASANYALILASPDTSEQALALSSAKNALAVSVNQLSKAQLSVLAYVPVSEIVYLNNLPRVVDNVTTAIGKSVGTGSLMTVTGADITATASVSERDGQQVKVGMKATADPGDGSSVVFEVISVSPHTAPPPGANGSNGSNGSPGTDGTSGSSQGSQTSGSDSASGSGAANGSDTQTLITFIPKSLTPGQKSLIQNQNIGLTIPLKSTGKKVLSVPLAALTTGANGKSRIEITSNPKNVRSAILIDITTGISAAGYAEITSEDKRVHVGTLVVVGR